jgi:hypothetical protein
MLFSTRIFISETCESLCGVLLLENTTSDFWVWPNTHDVGEWCSLLNGEDINNAHHR